MLSDDCRSGSPPPEHAATAAASRNSQSQQPAMTDTDLISAAPVPGDNSCFSARLKADLFPKPSSAKDAISSDLKSKLSISVQQTKAPFDQAVDKPDKKTPASDTHVTVKNQAGFKLLVSSRHAEITSLDFKCGKIDVKTVAHLTKDRWPVLCSLNLSSSNIKSDAISCLVGGDWPKLTHLDLSGNSLDEEAMFVMSDVGENWPNLETLNLRSVYAMTGSDVALLTHALLQLTWCNLCAA